MTGVFPLLLKAAKVVPAIFKKDSKLDYSNNCPISLLSNVEKVLEKHTEDCIPFSITIILSITYNLDSSNIGGPCIYECWGKVYS